MSSPLAVDEDDDDNLRKSADDRRLTTAINGPRIEVEVCRSVSGDPGTSGEDKDAVGRDVVRERLEGEGKPYEPLKRSACLAGADDGSDDLAAAAAAKEAC